MSNNYGGDLCLYVTNEKTLMDSSNYNEIDGLVFASLVYNEFESPKITWTEEELENGISLTDYAERLLDLYPEMGDGKEVPSEVADKSALLSAVSTSQRYNKCIVTNLAACNGTTIWDEGNVSTISEDAQWAAMTININDGTNTAVIAMRGTNGTTLGWSEDLEIGYEEYGTTAQRLSRDYIAACKADKMSLVAHSKGGNDIVMGYMMSEKSVRERVVDIKNYDGPGENYKSNRIFKEGYDELDIKLKNYYPENGVIGLLLCDNPGKQYYCKANIKGHMEDKWFLGEHDPYAWEFYQEGTLNNSKQGVLSKVINRVLDNSLGNLSNTERRYALRTLIEFGVPALIAKKPLSGYPITIDYSSWQAALLSIIQFWHTSPEQAWCALKLMRNLLAELTFEGFAIADFSIPSVPEFYYWIKELYDDVIRNFKDEAEELWYWAMHDEETGVRNLVVYDFSKCRFSVQVDKLMSCAEQLERIAANMRNQVLEIDTFKAKNTIIGLEYITGYIESACALADTAANNIENYGEMLYSIAQTYSAVEKDVLNTFAIQV